MKCLECLVACNLRLDVQDYLDPFQYAYRGTYDAVNTVVHLILKHLEKSKANARLLFIYFSLAFNLIQPHTLLSKLNQMNVDPYIIKWCHSFLTQIVQLDSFLNCGNKYRCTSRLCQFTDFVLSIYQTIGSQKGSSMANYSKESSPMEARRSASKTL